MLLMMTARDNLIADCQKEATLTAAGQNFIDDGTNGCYEGNTMDMVFGNACKIIRRMMQRMKTFKFF